MWFHQHFAVGVAGGMGEPVEGVVGQCVGGLRLFGVFDGFGDGHLVGLVIVERCLGGRFGLGLVGRACRLLDGHAMRLRQVDEVRGQRVLHAPLQRLPLGRELRERIEGGQARVVVRMHQHRDRRAQVGMRHEGKQALGLWGAFHQDAVGLQRLEGAQQAARAAGAVVANAEVVQR
jgi:hypothetical protein